MTRTGSQRARLAVNHWGGTALGARDVEFVVAADAISLAITKLEEVGF